ncbi:hypothetical protein JB92DRAFT_2763738, partial [Gautieria morchelliformis]
IDTFAEKSAILMNVLDDVSKLHPFVGVAVMAFKVVWTLEVNHRENNQKIKALHEQMSDMMSVLTQCQTDREGKTIQGRMQTLVEDTAKDIEHCGEVCNAYAKEKAIAKFFKSSVWVTRLVNVGVVFKDRREEFQFALTMHTASGVDTANRTLGNVNDTVQAMNEKMDMLLKIIQHAVSPEEQRLKEEAGNENILENEALLIRLAKGELRGASSSITNRSKVDAKSYTLEDLREDLRADPEEAIQKNKEAFARKISMQEKRLREEMEAIVSRESDRVIDAIKAGPHDEIHDPDWRGSTKSRYFVMGLRDHFHEKWDQGVTKGDAPGSAANPKDEWALAYLNIHWLQPIRESFDDDASGFITVGEVNTFTNARPLNWSLPRWIAFWAIGWHQTLTYYNGKIREVFAKMFAILPRIHVSNQASVNKYLSEVYRNVTTIEAAVNPCHVNEALQGKFQPYIESEEKRLRENLEMARYDIDDLDTLTLITGPGRIGKVSVLNRLKTVCVHVNASMFMA